MVFKYLLPLICGLTGAATWAQPPEARAQELRAALRQNAAGAQVTTTRQLSEPERAELRRQLSLYSRPQAKGS
jgi:hypothetical protein